MKTITITINVPDGVNVAVSQGGQAERPFVARPDPPYPDGTPECPVHGADWRLVKGGISKKSGKPFNSFWACSIQGCDEKPPREDRSELVDPLPF